MKLKRKRIGVLMGGFGSEREISLKSGMAVFESLKRSGYNAVGIDVGDDLVERIRSSRVEVAFVALHGPVGEDGIVQGVLEFMRIPYTGSGVMASALAMDKRISKRLFEAAGIPTAKWEAFHRDDKNEIKLHIRPPLVVKPSRQGSTVGVSIIGKYEPVPIEEAIDDAFKYDQWILVEKYVPGSEITVGVLDGLALGCVEIRPKGGFYDYKRKYTPGQTEYIAPAPTPPKLTKLLRNLSERAYESLDCRGAARVDFRVTKKGEPKILEVNTIPGMTSTSLLPKSAALMGIGFDSLVERILEGASYERP